MVNRFKTVKGTRVLFGDGTVRVRPHMLQSRFGGQIELSSIAASQIGEVPPKENYIAGSEKIVLEFKNVESLDVLMDKLQYLKEEMLKNAKA